jgi:hypothetical protein
VNTWTWIRFRIVGSSIWIKGWKDGDPEPGFWSYTGTDANVASGWMGFGLSTISANYDVDSYTITQAV